MEETQMGSGKPELNIKLSDAFRGRYELPIGGPCPVPFFMAHKTIRGKSEEPQRLPPVRGESFSIVCAF